MNGTLLSFIFFLIMVFLYWSFMAIREYFKNKRLSFFDNILAFEKNLNSLPKSETTKYYEVIDNIIDYSDLSKKTIYNKEYYYIDKKLVLIVKLKNNYINYIFKNKKLLK